MFESLLIKNDTLAVKQILDLNEFTSKRDLIFSREMARDLIATRNDILFDLGRIEVGSGILDQIIYEFYDSCYIDKDNYMEVFKELICLFYHYQMEFDNILSDSQILKYMRDYFELEGSGSLELLGSMGISSLREIMEFKNGYDENS